MTKEEQVEIIKFKIKHGIMKWWLYMSFLLNVLLIIMLIYLKRNRDWFMKSYYELASFVLKARREGKLWYYQQEAY